MKYTSLFLAALIFLVSCKKTEEQPKEPEAEPKFRLTAIRVSSISKSSSKKFEYNTAGFLIKYTSQDTTDRNKLVPISSTTTVIFERDGSNKHVSELVNNSGAGVYKGTYSYDIHDRVQKVSYTKNNQSTVEYSIYFGHRYDTVISVEYALPGFTSVIDYEIMYDTLGTGLVAQIETKKGSNPYFKEFSNISYDNKINPYKCIPGLHSYYYITGVSPMVFATHNPTSYKYTPDNGQAVVQYNVSYSYNYLDYVTQAVSTSPDGTVTYEYTYEKY